MAMFNSLFIVLGEHPNLLTNGYTITSPETVAYNCIAWASGNDSKFWWPDPMLQMYWPDDIPREESVQAFKALFESQGYEVTDNSDLEEGYEKVALYVDSNNVPKHAARQLPDGQWTSKLGRFHDIFHNIEGLEDNCYGTAIMFFKRPLSSDD